MNTLQQRRERLARERKALDELLQSALGQRSPGYLQAGDRIVPDFGSAITRLGDAYFGKKESDRLDAEEKQYAKDYSAGLEKATQSFADTSTGKKGEWSIDPESGSPMGPPTADIPADPKRAAVLALASGYPELKALAEAQFVASLKQETPKHLSPIKGVDPRTGRPIYAQPNDQGTDPRVLAGIEPEPDYKVVNNQLVDPAGGKPRVVGDYRDQFGEIVGATENTPAYVREMTTGRTQFGGFAPKAANIDARSTIHGNNQMITSAVSMAEKGRENMGGLVRKQQFYTDALSALQGMNDSDFGPAADLKLTAQKLAAQFGIPIDVNSVTSAERLKATMGQALLAEIRKLAPVSDDDAKRLERIIGGLPNTKAGFVQVAELIMGQAGKEIDDYNKYMDRLSGRFSREMGPDSFSHYKVDWNAKPILPPNGAPNAMPGAPVAPAAPQAPQAPAAPGGGRPPLSSFKRQ